MGFTARLKSGVMILMPIPSYNIGLLPTTSSDDVGFTGRLKCFEMVSGVELYTGPSTLLLKTYRRRLAQ